MALIRTGKPGGNGTLVYNQTGSSLGSSPFTADKDYKDVVVNVSVSGSGTYPDVLLNSTTLTADKEGNDGNNIRNRSYYIATLSQNDVIAFNNANTAVVIVNAKIDPSVIS